ncbi:MAG: glutamine-hydrolyzing carbamoyl-phosphate synthase small subunit [Gammaproteobacteria bacterium]|nr:glutamine-hydrolyzing carbamoyl-phosphate synthase small subunit [Gammaproteobacteria bacterium]
MFKSALLALEDGSLFWGQSIGAMGQSTGEVVFNTSITGYQEILSDPSYCKQIITLTYPHIGNIGTNDQDNESSNVWGSGLVIRDLSLFTSSFRSQIPLKQYLIERNVVGIADIDTRKLTRILREKGSLGGCIIACDDVSGSSIDAASAIEQAKAFTGLKGVDLAKEVTTSSVYEWNEGIWALEGNRFAQPTGDKAELSHHVVAYDFGIKRNILRLLVDRGCRVTVVPAQTPAQDVLDLKPDGIFLSNGPGDPEPCSYAIEAIKVLIETGKPMFGICLGHQLLSLACGAKSIKMKFGHHGANHPVIDLETKQVMITSQNHGFAVDEKSLPKNLQPTHRSLFDGSLQGVQRTDKPVFGFQGHPEASPGPHDINCLFDKYIELIKKNA